MVVPRAGQVSPVEAAARAAGPVNREDDVVYEFASCGALPVFDGRKCVKHVLLPPRVLRSFNTLLHRTRRWLAAVYGFAMICNAVVLFVPAAASHVWFVAAVFLLGCPSHIASFLALRYDVAVLVTRTFEFWYATLLSVVSTSLMGYTLGDARALIAAPLAVGFEVSFLIDAVFRAPRAAVASSLFGAFFNVAYVVASALGLIPNVRATVVIPLHQRQLASDVLIANGLATIALLMARNAYRKHEMLKQKPRHGAIVGSSIVYRCCLRLRPVRVHATLPVADPQSYAESILPADCCPLRPRPPSYRIQLVFDGSAKSFSARDVMLPRSLGRISLAPWPAGAHCVLHAVALASLAALVALHVPHALAAPLRSHAELALVAFAGAAVVCGVYFAHYQRQLLLHELCRSFDFLFIAAQSLIVHLCVCDFYRWDARCLGVAASFLWVQWLISLDAVTPVAKRKLAFHQLPAVGVGLVVLFEQLALVADLVFSDSHDYQERVLLSVHVAGREIAIRVVPLFLGRVATTFLWSLRVGWRLLRRRDGELVVLHGQLQYDDVALRAWSMRRASALLKPHPGPGPSASLPGGPS